MNTIPDLNELERLELNHVDLDSVKVYQQIFKDGYINSDDETRRMKIAGYACKYCEQGNGKLRVYIDRHHGAKHKTEGPFHLLREQVRDE